MTIVEVHHSQGAVNFWESHKGLVKMIFNMALGEIGGLDICCEQIAIEVKVAFSPIVDATVVESDSTTQQVINLTCSCKELRQ